MKTVKVKLNRNLMLHASEIVTILYLIFSCLVEKFPSPTPA